MVLRQVAAVMLQHIDSDDFAARYGGEEFVIILTAKTLEDSKRIMENILMGIASLRISEMDNNSVTASIGMHEYNGGDSKKLYLSASGRLPVRGQEKPAKKQNRHPLRPFSLYTLNKLTKCDFSFDDDSGTLRGAPKTYDFYISNKRVHRA
ncbi:diguanylate cyclase [Paenibacillus rhizoplanae]